MEFPSAGGGAVDACIIELTGFGGSPSPSWALSIDSDDGEYADVSVPILASSSIIPITEIFFGPTLIALVLRCFYNELHISFWLRMEKRERTYDWGFSGALVMSSVQVREGVAGRVVSVAHLPYSHAFLSPLLSVAKYKIKNEKKKSMHINVKKKNHINAHKFQKE